MEKKTIVYDKVLEVEETDYINTANKLLSTYEKIDETTCLTWDLISCVCSYNPRKEYIETIYVLGKKYKRIDHTNK